MIPASLVFHPQWTTTKRLHPMKSATRSNSANFWWHDRLLQFGFLSKVGTDDPDSLSTWQGVKTLQDLATVWLLAA
jgi:hypothetical protein